MQPSRWTVLTPIVLALVTWLVAGPAAAQVCHLDCNSCSACSDPCQKCRGYTQDGGCLYLGDWTTCAKFTCNPDPDHDGALCWDNCPNVYNPDQADCDGDGIGDVCDPKNERWQVIDTKDGVHVAGEDYDNNAQAWFCVIEQRRRVIERNTCGGAQRSSCFVVRSYRQYDMEICDDTAREPFCR